MAASNRMPLEDILLMLSAFGRPVLNQFSASATPGVSAAGRWNCEVHVPSLGPSDPAKSYRDHERENGVPITGWRLIGGGASPYEAADACLARCLELRESSVSAWAKFVSTEDVKAAERGRKG